MELYHLESRLKAAPTGQKKQSIQGCKVSFLIKLAVLYLKPETLKAKYQTQKQPNSQRRPLIPNNLKAELRKLLSINRLAILKNSLISKAYLL
jgi:hypothetical protein